MERRINRELHRADALMIQNSVWKHKEQKLMEIAVQIRNLERKL